MVTVAVAGGTGGIGSTIVDTLRQNPHHKMVILTRKMPDLPQLSNAFVCVDYSDIDSVAKVLDENKVHTVISALRVFDSATSLAESNIVKAAAKAESTKRFVASAWGIHNAETLARTPIGQARGRTLAELRMTNLEWTRFDNSYFLDYYAPPSQLKSHMNRVAWAIDMENKKAGIPGTGNDPMTFTYTFDVARFAVAALDLPKWDELMYCYGDKTTWKEFLKQAEEARGKTMLGNTIQRLWISRCKFDVSFDPPEKLQKGEVTELPGNEGTEVFSRKALVGLMAFWGLNALE
ncbi:unnamed protein product, partial [Fusarium equiseti]